MMRNALIISGLLYRLRADRSIAGVNLISDLNNNESEKMKLMLLLEKYSPEIDVAGLRMHEMVNAFSEDKNTDIRVVAYDPGSRSQNLGNNINMPDNVMVVRHVRKYLPRSIHLMTILNPFTLFCWGFVSIKETLNYRPDIIITTVPSWQPTIAAYITSVIWKTPFCIDIRDNWIDKNMEGFTLAPIPWYGKYPSRILYRFFRYLFLHSCKKALLLSITYESMREKLLEYTKSNVPIINVPNGINLTELSIIKNYFNKEEILLKNGIHCQNESNFVIYVGYIGRYYKPDLLLDPMKRLIDAGENINYVIVGEGPQKKMIKHKAEDMGISDRVFLLGNREHHEVIELLLASDVAFYALDENFPNPDCALGVKVLEYIACKLPTLSITGENSIVSDLITKWNIGIALRWDESDKMDKALQELLNNEKYDQNMAIYYEHFIKEFDRKRNNNQLYQEIVRYYHEK